MGNVIYESLQIEIPPIPKLETPALFLGAHGEHFNYATLEKDNLIFTMGEVKVPPGKGPPAHMHHFVAEWFYAPEGGITLFATEEEHLDTKNHPSREAGTQKTAYIIPLKPKQVFWCPKHRVHGYVNSDKVERPLTCFWKPYPDAPFFLPFKDGGIREFFEAVHLRINSTEELSITEKRRAHYIAESPKYMSPHSSYLLQFINRILPEIPESLQHSENLEELNEMIDLVNQYNKGVKGIICH